MKRFLNLSLLVLLGAGWLVAPLRAGLAPRQTCEKLTWHPAWEVQKWHSPVERVWGFVPPYETRRVPGNLMTTAGAGRILDLAIGAGGQVFNNSHARIGMGDASTAAAAGDTDLGAAAGSTHRFFQMADATFPSRVNNILSMQSTFGASDGNFAVTEVGMDEGTTSTTTVVAPLIVHKITSLGTKVSPNIWQVSYSVTLGP